MDRHSKILCCIGASLLVFAAKGENPFKRTGYSAVPEPWAFLEGSFHCFYSLLFEQSNLGPMSLPSKFLESFCFGNETND